MDSKSDGGTDWSALPRTADEAQRLGLRHCYTGKPCQHGHVAIRRVHKRGGSVCLICDAEALARWHVKRQEREAREALGRDDDAELATRTSMLTTLHRLFGGWRFTSSDAWRNAEGALRAGDESPESVARRDLAALLEQQDVRGTPKLGLMLKRMKDVPAAGSVLRGEKDSHSGLSVWWVETENGALNVDEILGFSD